MGADSVPGCCKFRAFSCSATHELKAPSQVYASILRFDVRLPEALSGARP
jgi:hypothetical protein